MTTRELLRWQRCHAQREARAKPWWTSPAAASIVATGAMAAVVFWRGENSVTGASHVWLAATLAAFALGFLRVPAQLYWRGDAPLLAQLPIDGRPLFDVALARCIALAARTTAIAALGAVPLWALDKARVELATRALQAVPIAGDPVARLSPFEFFARHVAMAGALGIAAAAWIPAVATWAASLVATGKAADAIRAATALAGGSAGNRAPAIAMPPQSSGAAVLGALPGVASSAVIVVAILVAPWLNNREAAIAPMAAFAIIALVSIVALLAMRSAAPRAMPAILRDVSSLDRQHLATLELHPPTPIERGIASLLGDAALPYCKDARLMRRRYPMAFALGALVFATLSIIGIVRPHRAAPWLIPMLVSAVLYGSVLAVRLWRSPIELPRLAATLPIPPRARTRAKIVWLAVWGLLFVAAPAAFALWRLH